MSSKTHPTEKFEIKSTIFGKLDPEERRRLNRAILGRNDSTYKACYEQFRLADRGVSYYVFYRYARNLRRQAALTDLAEARSPEGTDPVALNKAVTLQMLWRLIDAGDDETADSHVLLRLAKAHHLCLRTQKMIRDDHDRELKAFLELKVPNRPQGNSRNESTDNRRTPEQQRNARNPLEQASPPARAGTEARPTPNSAMNSESRNEPQDKPRSVPPNEPRTQANLLTEPSAKKSRSQIRDLKSAISNLRFVAMAFVRTRP